MSTQEGCVWRALGGLRRERVCFLAILGNKSSYTESAKMAGQAETPLGDLNTHQSPEFSASVFSWAGAGTKQVHMVGIKAGWDVAS